MKIAVLDNSLDRKLNNISIVKMNKTEEIQRKEISKFPHGTICGLILQKYCEHLYIYNIQILNDQGKGNISDLETALKWCVENKIQIINLSLGTTNFIDKKMLRCMINRYANKGLIIIAASSNKQSMTYPASFSNVIGVQNNGCRVVNDKYEICHNIHLGIDILASSVHSIYFNNTFIETALSNSYAAPFVTALICRLEQKNHVNNVSEAKLRLYNHITGTFTGMYRNIKPDWIENAYLCTCKNEKLSKANYYFTSYKGVYENAVDFVDTIIVYFKEEYNRFITENKHIIYLGKEQINIRSNNKFIWQPSIRINQIRSIKSNKLQIDIPILFIIMDEQADEFYVLTKLREMFYEEEYNAYTTSLDRTSVLYDLEYLPKECINDETDNNKIRQFLAEEVFYQQSDLLIFSFREDMRNKIKTLFSDVDLEIFINTGENISIVQYDSRKQINSSNIVYEDKLFINNIYTSVMKLIY